MPSDHRQIESSLDAHLAEWMAISGVVGAGIGEWEGRPCIKIFVSRPAEEFSERIPSSVEGYEIRLEETGEFRALGIQKNSHPA